MCIQQMLSFSISYSRGVFFGISNTFGNFLCINFLKCKCAMQNNLKGSKTRICVVSLGPIGRKQNVKQDTRNYCAFTWNINAPIEVPAFSEIGETFHKAKCVSCNKRELLYLNCYFKVKFEEPNVVCMFLYSQLF